MSVLRGLALATLTACALPGAARAQERLRDLELSAGLSVEGYRGNLTAATVSAVDSTESATAAVGELGGGGTVALIEADRRWLFLTADGGMRQFAAGGFEIRDYAPREWVGSGVLSYSQLLGSWAVATGQLGWRGRAVQDRPPMPLFLQPGFGIGSMGLRIETNEIDRVSFDVGVDAEWADYTAGEFSGPLDLLDRRTLGIEAGATWGDVSLLRVAGGFRSSLYRNQATFDAADPERRDHTLHAGVSWSLDAPVTAELGVEATVNRSNSMRPEYDAIAGRALLSVPLPFDVGATVLAVITAKSYVSQTEFTLLVPGEEADNASVLYLDLARPLALGLDGSVRLGWTRAEADVGDQYFQRFGASLQLRYRPAGF
jgi:hypothetical protein